MKLNLIRTNENKSGSSHIRQSHWGIRGIRRRRGQEKLNRMLFIGLLRPSSWRRHSRPCVKLAFSLILQGFKKGMQLKAISMFPCEWSNCILHLWNCFRKSSLSLLCAWRVALFQSIRTSTPGTQDKQTNRQTLIIFFHFYEKGKDRCLGTELKKQSNWLLGLNAQK